MLVNLEALWTLLVVVLWAGAAYGTQVPLNRVSESDARSVSVDLELDGWDLDVGPPANSTDNLVFDTVSSLLQHWPNTRYRNGHTLVPGTIPPGTLLYHGTSTPHIPSVPEWLATDPEHSYLFCRTFVRNSTADGCWHLTLSTTRTLRILYFDGSSAAKMGGGSMDSQDVLLWGRVREEWTFAERKRIKELCEWGKGLGVDGFVRMEMDFEIMLCDFTDGVEVSSFLNLATQIVGRPPRPPHNTATATATSSPPTYSATTAPSPGPTSLPSFFNTASFLASLQPEPKRGPLIATVLQSGSWHNHFPGDPRIQLSLPHLVSFYDTSLAPSLSALRAGKERWEHRLMGIGGEDVGRVMRRLEGAFGELGAEGEEGNGGNGGKEGRGSGVDWAGVIRVLGVRYAERLELVKHFVTATTTTTTEETNTTENARRIQTQLRIMLTPYILFSASPPPPPSQNKNTTNTWATPIYTHCASAHTRSLLSPSLQKKMTHAEKLMLRAIRGTEREICRVVVRMWAEGVMKGLDPVLGVGGERKGEGEGGREGEGREGGEKEVGELMKWWKGEVDALMGWLDWSVWVKCVPACGFEEMCYLPTWPFFPRDGPPYNPDEPDEKDWVVPKPRCLRRVEPYEF